MRLAGFLLSSPLACHAGLACWSAILAPPHRPNYGQFWRTYRCFPLFLPLIDAFPAPIDAPFTNFSPHQSLIDALFTYGHAIAHRQVNIASIRPGRRVCDSTRAGGVALLRWCMVLFREVAWNRAQIRAHIRARMWAQAPAASMAATKNRLATLTVVRRHLTSSSGGH